VVVAIARALPGCGFFVLALPALAAQEQQQRRQWGSPMQVAGRILIWVLFVAFWIALAPPLFTHGACTSEFDAYSAPGTPSNP
jgi:hypothetical protein